MSPAEQEKIELEHQAARLFMRHWERNQGVPIRHIWHNRPDKPDVSCFLDGERLDLEIAHLYGSEAEAMAILGRDLSDATVRELAELNASDTDGRLLRALNRILAMKAEKTYNSDRVWLVIRNANPHWSRTDIEALQHHISVPDGHPFEQIWLVADMYASSGIVQLYP
ncbi:hypothetical protein BGP77_10195 [Saccharospirillum sp. MSK14-1]|uniref:hypothetical protein n=1 Tax=Saccharospirillum sp. MSK14-1 TaxID=1897632 RepID=UPI000D3BF22B|nr:hypothetical protein [Saccharospirillum sp. MSK14-1]PTY38820.1 hypothetical protein BGP77_10195 [Saccharospirillum sp. MSK14-1]